MIVEPSRVSVRGLGVDLGRPRNSSTDDPSTAPEVAQLLSGLVILSIGRGSPEQIAVNRALKAAGAVVLVRTSAGEMAQMLRAFVPSLIVTEVVPGDDGASAVLRAIPQLPPDHGRPLPVIGICARATDGSSMIRAEFQGLLVDPFEPGDVARIVLRAIEGST
jgi:hypothetical protein